MSGGTNERDAAPESDAGKGASQGGADARRESAPSGANARPEPDAEATVRMQLPAEPDAESTVRMPIAEPDPDATFRGPLKGDDPEATVSGPLLSDDDPEATFRGPAPVIDEDVTVAQPAARVSDASSPPASVDPDATVHGVSLAPDPDDTDTSFKPADLGLSPPAKRSPFAPMPASEAVHANLAELGGLNPLVAAAASLFSAATHIRSVPRHPAPESLQNILGERMHQFEADLAATDVDADTADAACIALCALVDESASAAPWGEAWSKNGMAQQVYGVAVDPGRVFALVESSLQAPDTNRDLLEFLYLCLMLGYEGQYRGTEAGPGQLADLRARLYAAVRRPRANRALAPAWQGVSPGLAPQGRAGPLWVAALAGLLAIGIHQAVQAPSGMRSQVPPVALTAAPVAPSGTSTVTSTPTPAPAPAPIAAAPTPAPVTTSPAPPPVAVAPPAPSPAPAPAATAPSAAATAIAPRVAAPPVPAPVAIEKSPVPAPPAAAPPVTPPETVRDRLAADIGRGVLTLTESAGRTTIEFREARQFASAQVQPAASIRPLIERVAVALDPLPGRILVLGYADATPLRTGAFASNAALSLARAQAASALMGAKLADAKRLRAEGRGERDLIDTGTSAAARARNRRVVIVLEATP